MFVGDRGTNSIISNSIYGQLTAAPRGLLRPSHSWVVLADGSSTKIFGEISHPVKLRHLKKEVTLNVARINQHAIRGLDAMKAWNAVIVINSYVVNLDGYELSTVDRDGNVLVTEVQVYKTIEIPGSSDHRQAGDAG